VIVARLQRIPNLGTSFIIDVFSSKEYPLNGLK
jgi:hypothetical protein